jgi:hypothetical protein
VQQRLYNKFGKLKEYLLTVPKSFMLDENGVAIKARRIELFYGLQGLTGYDLSNRCAELLEDRKFRFLYPDPSVCCPSVALLIV